MIEIDVFEVTQNHINLSYCVTLIYSQRTLTGHFAWQRGVP